MPFLNRDDEFMATRIDQYGNRVEYFPYAFFAFEGAEYLVMRTEDEGNTSDVLVLESQENADGERVYTVAEDSPRLQELINTSLGLNYQIIH